VKTEVESDFPLNPQVGPSHTGCEILLVISGCARFFRERCPESGRGLRRLGDRALRESTHGMGCPTSWDWPTGCVAWKTAYSNQELRAKSRDFCTRSPGN